VPRPEEPSDGPVLGVLRHSTTPDRVETGRIRPKRRIVVIGTGVIGAVLLGLAIAQPRDSSAFSVLALLTALTWTLGGILSGPLHLGQFGWRRQVLVPVLLGAVAFGVFAIGAFIVRHLPPLHSAVNDVLARADIGPRWRIVTVTLANAVAEEIYFRGALYSMCGPHRPVWWSTVAYVAVTAVSGNVMLIFAAAVMGTLFALERWNTGGILAPTMTHVTWSALMLFLLPR
jgi:membrane protease YdiL (CAAX protease family)